jgi:hypothetical protein
VDALPYIPLIVSGLTALGLIARQIRLTIQDVGERRLARHVFNHTRDTGALGGYTRMIEARNGKGSSSPAQHRADESEQGEIES